MSFAIRAARSPIASTSRSAVRTVFTSAVWRAEAPAGPSLEKSAEVLQSSLESMASRAAASLGSANRSGNLQREVNAEDAGPQRRQFNANTTYSPHELTATNLYPAPKRNARPALLGPSRAAAQASDPFLNAPHTPFVNPLNEAMNPAFVSDFLSQMGKIKRRCDTGLSWKSQRMVGKMVRRARGMGLISKWSNQLLNGRGGY